MEGPNISNGELLIEPNGLEDAYDTEPPVDESDTSENEEEDTVPQEHMQELLQKLLKSCEQGLELEKVITEKQISTLRRRTNDVYYCTAFHNLINLSKREAYKSKKSRDAIGKIVKFLVKKFRDLLLSASSGGPTALQLAIESKNNEVVEVICNAHDTIDELFRTTTRKRGNYVHLAVQHGLDLKVLLLLAEKTTPETLCAKDENGNTTLHLAVRYDLFRSDQIKLVQSLVETLVEKCDQKMKESEGTFSEPEDLTFNNAKQSPYMVWKQSGENARQRQEEKRQKKERRDRKNKRTGVREEPTSRGPDQRNQHQQRVNMKSWQTTGPPPEQRIGSKGRQREASSFNGRDGKSKEVKLAPRPGKVDPVSAKRDGHVPIHMMAERRDESAEAMSRKSLPEGRSESQGRRARPLEYESREDVAQEIGRFLELHYLLSRSTGAARDIIYGRDIQTG